MEKRQLREAVNEAVIRDLMRHEITSDKVKAALERALALRAKVMATQEEAGRKEQRCQEIRVDQERLRENLKQLPPTSAAYKRYVEKFDRQESEMEELAQMVLALREKLKAQHEVYVSYLAHLTVE